MRYTSDLTQSEWDLISCCFPKASSFGRPRKYPYLEIFNGILYINKTGCQWRNLPKDLPPWASRSEEHTSELQSLRHLVCRLLLEKKKTKTIITTLSHPPRRFTSRSDPTAAR